MVCHACRGRWVLLSLITALAGCAATPDEGAGHYLFGERIEPMQRRVVVGGVIDKTGRNKVVSEQFNAGVRDLLITALFEAKNFAVLERDALDEVLLEQEFSNSAAVGDQSRLPLGQLQGSELLLVGAITSFDDSVEGGIGFPVPIPIGNGWANLALLDLDLRKSQVTMDLRLVDVATGQVIKAAAVEGKASKFGFDVSYLNLDHDFKLPGVLNAYANTPVETALRKMINAAIEVMDEVPVTPERAIESEQQPILIQEEASKI